MLSSHSLSEVERLADKIVIIRQGDIVERGSLEELRHLTRSTVVMETENDASKMLNMKGIHDFVQKDNQTIFSLDHKYLNDILIEASKLGVKNIEVTPPTLEDLFMRHYQG